MRAFLLHMCIVCLAIVHTHKHNNLVSSDNSCIFCKITDQHTHTHRGKSTSVSVRANTSQRAVMIRGRWTGRMCAICLVYHHRPVIKSVAMDTFILPPVEEGKRNRGHATHGGEDIKTHHSCRNGQTSKRQMPTDHHRSFPKPRAAVLPL